MKTLSFSFLCSLAALACTAPAALAAPTTEPTAASTGDAWLLLLAGLAALAFINRRRGGGESPRETTPHQPRKHPSQPSPPSMDALHTATADTRY